MSVFTKKTNGPINFTEKVATRQGVVFDRHRDLYGQFRATMDGRFEFLHAADTSGLGTPHLGPRPHLSAAGILELRETHVGEFKIHQ